jgi:SulP family sulfate permease
VTPRARSRALSRIIDLSRAHVWDASAVAALERHYVKHGTAAEITGLNRECEHLHATLSGQLAGAH